MEKLQFSDIAVKVIVIRRSRILAENWNKKKKI